MCDASKLLLELPCLPGAGAFLLLTQAASASSPHFSISRIPQLVLSLNLTTCKYCCTPLLSDGGDRSWGPPREQAPLGRVPPREGMVNLLKR